MQWKITGWTKSNKKTPEHKITVITVIKQQLEFHYFIDII